VGHSIIPDKINGVIKWFWKLLTDPITAVNQLITSLTTILGGLGAKALGWAGDMMNQFVQGIENGIGAVGTAVQKIAGKIAGFLHFSKPDIGPLADADLWMPDFMNLLSKGIDDNIDKVKASAMNITTEISAVAPNPSSLPQGPNAGSGSNDKAVQVLMQILTAIQSGNRQQLTPPSSNTLGAMTQQFGNVSFNGNMDANALQQMINQLQGLQVQYSQRGALFNY